MKGLWQRAGAWVAHSPLGTLSEWFTKPKRHARGELTGQDLQTRTATTPLRQSRPWVDARHHRILEPYLVGFEIAVFRVKLA